MEQLVVPLSNELVGFIAAAKWTFARTMPEWPHEYIVRQRVDPILFDRLAGHIQAHGFEGHYYERKNLYFRDGELRYGSLATSSTGAGNMTPMTRAPRGESCRHAKHRMGSHES